MTNCRLCNGELIRLYDLRILNQYQVTFFQCHHCESLQTEMPYWLNEAYADNNLSNLDTGAAQRNIHNLAACFAICKLLNINNIVDIGGGDGLLCRMLRDYRINCYVKDKYARPAYAQGFTDPNFTKPDLVIGFEVIEHFANPETDLASLFDYEPKHLLLSTGIYSKQDKDWWYLTPESGQHVFFYSKKALEIIAGKYNYSLIVSGGFILFSKQISTIKKLISTIVLSKTVCRLIRAFVVLLPARGIVHDQNLQIEKNKQKIYKK